MGGPVTRVRLRRPEWKGATHLGADPPVAPEVLGLALIDTGAQATCVDRRAAGRAGLLEIDAAVMGSATHSHEQVPVFAGQLDILDLPGTVTLRRGLGANLESQGLIALIGRDVLSQCLLICNGPDGSFTLSL